MNATFLQMAIHVSDNIVLKHWGALTRVKLVLIGRRIDLEHFMNLPDGNSSA